MLAKHDFLIHEGTSSLIFIVSQNMLLLKSNKIKVGLRLKLSQNNYPIYLSLVNPFVSIKRSIDETLVKAIPHFNDAKTFLTSIKKRYVVFDEGETSQLMESFINMKYDRIGGVRKHIMKMVTIANKLNDPKCHVANNFLICCALNSLPSKFDVLKTFHNTQKEEWDINTLIFVYE